MSESSKEKTKHEKVIELKARKANNEKFIELFRFRLWIFVLATVLGASALYFEIVVRGDVKLTFVEAIPPILLGAAGGAIIYAIFVGYITLIFSMISNKLDIQLAKEGAEELQEQIEENFFTKLVQINFKYIDQYYLQTQEQANKSFRLSMFACLAGLVVIVLGIVMMFQGKTEPAYVTTAAGILSEFIAAVFFYLYNKTIVKMSEYHQKLVITQNISLALKIAEELPEKDKTDSQKELIKQLTTNVNEYLSLNSSMVNKPIKSDA